MSYNRFQQQSSPWTSGAPPMYGNHNHVPQHPPPHQYAAPVYGHQTPAWNPAPVMRGNNWAQPNPQHTMQPIQGQQRRGGFGGMRGPAPGPTGKRGNMGHWDGPPNKRFAKQGGGRGGHAGGGNWNKGGGGGQGGQKFQNRNQNQNNRRNNREVNRTKQNDNTQLERRQQHDQAQKAAESLENKEYPIVSTVVKPEETKPTDDKSKNLEIDSAQEKYLLAVFGYVCQVCSVFLKDKSARFDHCQTEEHVNKFNAAEEERVKKEEQEKKGKESEDVTQKTNDSSVEPKIESNEANEKLENGEKSEETNEIKKIETNSEVASEDQKDSTPTTQTEEIKTNNQETPVVAEQTADESGGKTTESLPKPSVETPTPAVIPQSQPANTFTGGDYTPNRGRGNYSRGRGNHGGRGGPRGRGRNRGRGRK